MLSYVMFRYFLSYLDNSAARSLAIDTGSQIPIIQPALRICDKL